MKPSGRGRLVAVILAGMLAWSSGAISYALEKRPLAKGITMISLLQGESYTVLPGTILEALQDGSAVLMGGGSAVTWTFKDHDVFTMDSPYTTVKNTTASVLGFYAIDRGCQ